MTYASQHASLQKQQSEEERANRQRVKAILDYNDVLLEELVHKIIEHDRRLGALEENTRAVEERLRALRESNRRNAQLQEQLCRAMDGSGHSSSH